MSVIPIYILIIMFGKGVAMHEFYGKESCEYAAKTVEEKQVPGGGLVNAICVPKYINEK